MRLLVRYYLVFLCLCLSACATSAGKSIPGTGIKIEKSDTTFEDVWDAALRATSRSYPIISTDESRGTIEIKRGTGSVYWHDSLTVLIAPEQAKPDTYSVEVITYKRMENTMMPDTFAQIVLESIKAELDLINKDQRVRLRKRLGLE